MTLPQDDKRNHIPSVMHSSTERPWSPEMRSLVYALPVAALAALAGGADGAAVAAVVGVAGGVDCFCGTHVVPFGSPQIPGCLRGPFEQKDLAAFTRRSS